MLEQGITASRKGIAGVLGQLRNALTFDPQQAQSATEAYSMVVGATCQQSAGAQMSNLKEVSGLESTAITFDTVVIDEAARANPLDLFVPMAMATRRIVLVGDDRQLPHLLEPDIEEGVAAEHNLTDVQRKALKPACSKDFVFSCNDWKVPTVFSGWSCSIHSFACTLSSATLSARTSTSPSGWRC